jgi:intracellular sulfur oxidation DsrE/DsrF family protein
LNAFSAGVLLLASLMPIHAYTAEDNPSSDSTSPSASELSVPAPSPEKPSQTRATGSSMKRPTGQSPAKDIISLQDLYMIRIRDHSKSEIFLALKRLEASAPAAVSLGETNPAKLILSGEEIRWFLASAYSSEKSLINRIATLDALGIVEVKACETWMRSQGISSSELLPFVETVPYGPDESKRLLEDGYHYL